MGWLVRDDKEASARAVQHAIDSMREGVDMVLKTFKKEHDEALEVLDAYEHLTKAESFLRESATHENLEFLRKTLEEYLSSVEKIDKEVHKTEHFLKVLSGNGLRVTRLVQQLEEQFGKRV